jgi:hypothetical protein
MTAFGRVRDAGRTSLAFAYGNAGIKAGVASFATIALLVWLRTSFDR